jgi:hypothetical protein
MERSPSQTMREPAETDDLFCHELKMGRQSRIIKWLAIAKYESALWMPMPQGGRPASKGVHN